MLLSLLHLLLQETGALTKHLLIPRLLCPQCLPRFRQSPRFRQNNRLNHRKRGEHGGTQKEKVLFTRARLLVKQIQETQ